MKHGIFYRLIKNFLVVTLTYDRKKRKIVGLVSSSHRDGKH